MLPIQFFNADINLLQTYDQSIIQNAFHFIARQSQIEFNYPQGGCQQRAHIMSLMLSKRFSINHCKVWLFAPVTMHVHDSRSLFIPDKNQVTPNNIVEWNYHVAPVVRVSNESTADVMVIDPSINSDAPILLNDWFAAIGNSNASEYTFTLPYAYFFNGCLNSNNELTPLFDGSFFGYEAETRDNLIMEKGLALNDMAMKIYYTHLQALSQSENESDKMKTTDLKDIFGNATVLDLLFAQNVSAATFNTTQRYVITNYKDIINEARTIFYERLFYWTQVTNKLFYE